MARSQMLLIEYESTGYFQTGFGSRNTFGMRRVSNNFTMVDLLSPIYLTNNMLSGLTHYNLLTSGPLLLHTFRTLELVRMKIFAIV